MIREKLKVGQVLFWVKRYRHQTMETDTATVVSVGNKWATVKKNSGYGFEARVLKSTWQVPNDPNGFHGTYYASREEWQLEMKTAKVWDAIWRSVRETYRPPAIPLADLEIIARLLGVAPKIEDDAA